MMIMNYDYYDYYYYCYCNVYNIIDSRGLDVEHDAVWIVACRSDQLRGETAGMHKRVRG